jgi:hypothetical protein
MTLYFLAAVVFDAADLHYSARREIAKTPKAPRFRSERLRAEAHRRA